VSDGLAVSLAEAAFASGIGAEIELPQQSGLFSLFGEAASQAIITCAAENLAGIAELAEAAGVALQQLGRTGGDQMLITSGASVLVQAALQQLRAPWANGLEDALHSEVTA
jgi:phosphoribosylformylglycinamidine synthase